MSKKICSFCGHRNFDSSLSLKVQSEILNLIKYQGISTFYSGGMGNFDKICESIVRRLKQHYKIRLCLVMPYMTKSINSDKKYYEQMYDEIIIPDIGDIYYKRAITERNKWLVDHSDVILCFIEREYGGAYAMYRYAKGKCIRQNIKVME